LVKDDRFSVIAEPAAYAEAVWTPLPSVKLVPGIRLDYDATMNDAWVDPRLSAFVTLREGSTLKGAVGLFHQPPDYRQGLLSEALGNPDLAPEGAVHYSLGGEHAFSEAFGIDVQLFYKTLFQQA